MCYGGADRPSRPYAEEQIGKKVPATGGGASVEELENLGRGKLYAAARGDVEEGSVMAGQGAALVKKIQPAREILREVAEEAEKLLAGCSVPVVG